MAGYDDYAAQVENMKRRRQMAQALAQGGGDRINQVGGVAVPYHWGEGLAQLGRAYLGGRAERKVDEEEKGLRKKRSEDVAAALSGLNTAVPDDEVGRTALDRINATPDGELMEPVTGRSEAISRVAREMMPSEEAAAFELQRAMTPKPGPMRVRAGETLLDPQTLSPLFTGPSAKKGSGFSLGPGYTRFDESGKQIASVAPEPEKPSTQYRTLSAEEIAAAGLPAGTSAERNTQTNETRVLSKRDNTGTLSQKDSTTAKLKLNTIKLARQQLNGIKQQFADIKDTLAAGPESRAMVLSPKAQQFDAAVDQMRSTLTALTRVPGVGAMSDYETRLDQSKFPSRLKFESVTEQQINALDDMLNVIDSGYADLLSGGAMQSPDIRQPGRVPTVAPAAGELSDEELLRRYGGS